MVHIMRNTQHLMDQYNVISPVPIQERGPLQGYSEEHQRSSESLEMLLGSLEPHQWLSPSVMNWNEWDSIIEVANSSNVL